MRISDWSSDVCSSDLDEGGADVDGVRALAGLLHAHGDAAVPVPALLQHAKALAAVGVAALADREVGVLLAQRDLAVERGERRHPEGLALLGRRAGTVAAILAGALAQHGIESGDMRSEEHTSELQSLMRNSY